MRTLVPLVVMVAGCASAEPTRAPVEIAGSYAIWICDSACTLADTARAHTAGLLVLTAQPLDSTYAHMPHGAWLRFAPRNVCYDLVRRREVPGSFAGGAAGFGVSSWRSTQPMNVEFGLYRSPDASYHVTATVAPNTLVGEGRSFGPRDEAWQAEKVYGVRLGDPQPDRCDRIRRILQER